MSASLTGDAGGLGVVLSGGGSRGAYEVGVLSYVFRDLRKGRPLPISIVSGTSVGAVNGAFLASAADELDRGLMRLEEMWGALQLTDVMSFGFRQAAGLHRVLLGGRRATGIFDATPLVKLVGEGILWRQLARNLRSQALTALVISTTSISTGRPVVFIDARPAPEDLLLRMHGMLGRNVAVRVAKIGPAHVLASAAIPLVFPPVRVGKQLHCDGGLRLNTPMAPAIHLGADKLFVIGVSDPLPSENTAHGLDVSHLAPSDPGAMSPPIQQSRLPESYPGASFLLGKVVNAFLLDHLNADLAELQQINSMIRDGIEAFGPDYLEKVNAVRAKKGVAPRRLVDALAVRPSVDVGKIASAHLKRYRARFRAALGRQLLRLLDVGEGGDADLASYLLFDGTFARELIALGRADAHARRDELESFLFG